MSEFRSYNAEAEKFSFPKNEGEKQLVPAVDKDEEDEEEKTASEADKLFEDAVINFFNQKLEKEGKELIPLDGTGSLEWVVDEEAPEGRLAIIRRGIEDTRKKEYVLEEDKKTGEKYEVEKMPESFKPHEVMSRFYNLRPEEAREIFDKLEPAVKKIFLNVLRENLDGGQRSLAIYKKELEGERREQKRKDLEKEISDQELMQENITKELKALE